MKKQIEENFKSADLKEKTTLSEMMVDSTIGKYQALGYLYKIFYIKRYTNNRD